MPCHPATAHRPALKLAASVAAVFLLVLLTTSPMLPMVWDEGNTLNRAVAISDGHWPYTTVGEGHPPLSGLLVLAGWTVGEGRLPPLVAARLGPIALFSLAAGVMAYRLSRNWSLAAGLGGAAALMLLPRVFAHAHFATLDGPLTACRILAWATFLPAIRDSRGEPIAAAGRSRNQPGATGVSPVLASPLGQEKRGAGPAANCLIWGVALGLCFAAKATGWLAPLPFLAYGLIDRRWAVWRALLIGGVVAISVFYAVNPPLWSEPIRGLGTFFQLNLGRADQPGLNITTWFLGRMHNIEHPLPWYNTLVWVAVTVPPALLGFAVIGLVTIWRERRTHLGGLLLVLNFALLLIVRALPGVPPHDGVRLFLPSFAFLAGCSGIGVHATLGWVARRWGPSAAVRRRALAQCHLLYPPSGRVGRGSGRGGLQNFGIFPRFALPARSSRPSRREGEVQSDAQSKWRRAVAVVVGLYLTAAVELVVYAPQWLSYYSPAVGGLPGAAAIGMEPTYWWDALDAETLAWLHRHTEPDATVSLAAGSYENLPWMRRWGVLRRDAAVDHPGEFRWYVVQHRPSAWRPVDQWLIEHAEPAYRKTLLGTPLVSVYDYHDWQAARRTVEERRSQ